MNLLRSMRRSPFKKNDSRQQSNSPATKETVDSVVDPALWLDMQPVRSKSSDMSSESEISEFYDLYASGTFDMGGFSRHTSTSTSSNADEGHEEKPVDVSSPLKRNKKNDDSDNHMEEKKTKTTSPQRKSTPQNAKDIFRKRNSTVSGKHESAKQEGGFYVGRDIQSLLSISSEDDDVYLRDEGSASTSFDDLYDSNEGDSSSSLAICHPILLPREKAHIEEELDMICSLDGHNNMKVSGKEKILDDSVRVKGNNIAKHYRPTEPSVSTKQRSIEAVESSQTNTNSKALLESRDAGSSEREPPQLREERAEISPTSSPSLDDPLAFQTPPAAFTTPTKSPKKSSRRDRFKRASHKLFKTPRNKGKKGSKFQTYKDISECPLLEKCPASALDFIQEFAMDSPTRKKQKGISSPFQSRVREKTRHSYRPFNNDHDFNLHVFFPDDSSEKSRSVEDSSLIRITTKPSVSKALPGNTDSLNCDNSIQTEVISNRAKIASTVSPHNSDNVPNTWQENNTHHRLRDSMPLSTEKGSTSLEHYLELMPSSKPILAIDDLSSTSLFSDEASKQFTKNNDLEDLSRINSRQSSDTSGDGPLYRDQTNDDPPMNGNSVEDGKVHEYENSIEKTSALVVPQAPFITLLPCTNANVQPLVATGDDSPTMATSSGFQSNAASAFIPVLSEWRDSRESRGRVKIAKEPAGRHNKKDPTVHHLPILKMSNVSEHVSHRDDKFCDNGRVRAQTETDRPDAESPHQNEKGLKEESARRSGGNIVGIGNVNTPNKKGPTRATALIKRARSLAQGQISSSRRENVKKEENDENTNVKRETRTASHRLKLTDDAAEDQSRSEYIELQGSTRASNTVLNKISTSDVGVLRKYKLRTLAKTVGLKKVANTENISKEASKVTAHVEKQMNVTSPRDKPGEQLVENEQRPGGIEQKVHDNMKYTFLKKTIPPDIALSTENKAMAKATTQAIPEKMKKTTNAEITRKKVPGRTNIIKCKAEHRERIIHNDDTWQTHDVKSILPAYNDESQTRVSVEFLKNSIIHRFDLNRNLASPELKRIQARKHTTQSPPAYDITNRLNKICARSSKEKKEVESKGIKKDSAVHCPSKSTVKDLELSSVANKPVFQIQSNFSNTNRIKTADIKASNEGKSKGIPHRVVNGVSSNSCVSNPAASSSSVAHVKSIEMSGNRDQCANQCAPRKKITEKESTRMYRKDKVAVVAIDKKTVETKKSLQFWAMAKQRAMEQKDVYNK